MDKAVDGIGLVSSFLITIMFVPQVVHAFAAEDTRAINSTFLYINLLASVMALFFSVYNKVLPMMITNISAALFSVSLLSIKWLKESKANTNILAPMV